MDVQKCKSLKAQFASEADPLVPIGRFFDGNDDPASIGCNLPEHPGMGVFRDILVGLTRRPDVEAVYARISELDPGEGSWPFSDTVLVVGRIEREVLEELVGPLEPDEVGPADARMPPLIGERHDGHVLVVWWD